MIQISVRQEVFNFMDSNPKAKPKTVRGKFPDYNGGSVNQYIKQWRKEQKKKSELRLSNGNITKNKVSNKGNMLVLGKQEKRIEETPKEYHILNLLKTYPTLPLFIHSQIYKIVLEDYGYFEEVKQEEFNKLAKGSYLENWIINPQPQNYTFCYFDLFMQIFNNIGLGKYDNEINRFMNNIIKNYGDVYCDMKYDCIFDKDQLEEEHISYYTKEQIDHWNNCAREWFEDKDITEEYYKKQIERNNKLLGTSHTYHNGDYIEALSYIKDDIAKIEVLVKDLLYKYPKRNERDFRIIRIKILSYLFIDFYTFPQFRFICHNISLKTLEKICLEYNNVCKDSKSLNDIIAEYNEYFEEIVENENGDELFVVSADHIDIIEEEEGCQWYIVNKPLEPFYKTYEGHLKPRKYYIVD